jgi:hypothetical protein
MVDQLDGHIDSQRDDGGPETGARHADAARHADEEEE